MINRLNLLTKTHLLHISMGKISPHLRMFAFSAFTFLVLASTSFSARAQTWSSTGSLTTERYWHTATLLSNGKVLVAGGYYPNISSCELYDPSTGTWSSTGSLITARSYHTATLLSNGKVLVVGGEGNSGLLSSCELYDPFTGTWSSTGSLTTARSISTATLLSNGKVLVAGGYGGSNGGGSIVLSSCELYDPSTGTWSSTGSLTTARWLHSATVLSNGKVLVAGGFDPSSGIFSSCELYDPSSGTWGSTGSLTNRLHQHTATLLSNGKVLIAGGFGNNGISNICELYDPSAGTWGSTGSLTTVRYVHTATLLSNGKVLVTGGFGNGSYLSSCELYDPSSGTWSSTGTLTTPRYGHTATLLSNNNVLVAGGEGDSGLLSSCELFETSCIDLVHCNISVTPSNNTYTGGIATNIYLGYGPQSATMSASATGGSGFTYSWSPSTYLNSSTTQSPVFTPTAEGDYTYTVTITNSNNCSTECSVSFCVKDVVVSGSGGKKVYLCHVPSGNPSNPQTLSISTNAVKSHLTQHSGDALGICGATCNSNMNNIPEQLVIDTDNLEITCFPNPFDQSFKLNYTSALSSEATISVYGITGNLLERTTASGISNQVELGQNLPAGIYTISFIQGTTYKIFKMIKVH